nr:hypothetical protein [Cuspidothrix issatschenkoi]
MLPKMPDSTLPFDSVVQSRDVRQLGINPYHWYVVARGSDVTNKPLPTPMR